MRKQVTIGDHTFDYSDVGEGERLVIFLHGFPETSRMWDAVLQEIAAAGYRCVAPDQRGYSPGARPADVDAYKYAELAGDVVALGRALGHERFDLVGHDWGAIVGWAVVASAPEVVRTWTALSVPHNAAFAQAVRDDEDEAYYRGMLEMFMAPDHTAEQLFSADDFAMLKAAWSESSETEIEHYLDCFRQPGALTGALNYYRASGAHARALDDDDFVFGPVATPTRLIWGRTDPYILRGSIDRGEKLMTGPYQLTELDAGHWLVQERFAEVVEAIREHLATGA